RDVVVDLNIAGLHPIGEVHDVATLDRLTNELAIEDGDVGPALGGKIGEDLVVPLRNRHATNLYSRVLIALHQLAKRLARLPRKPDNLQISAAAGCGRRGRGLRSRGG